MQGKYINPIITAKDGNQQIFIALRSSVPFLATKLGNIEQDVCMSYLQSGDWSSQLRHLAQNNAGISPADDYVLQYFCERYIAALPLVDLVGVWYHANESLLINKFAQGATFSELRALESFYHSEPWSSALAGKKVLLVHPFEDSIKAQYKIRHLLFEDPNILPQFDLVTLKAIQTQGGGTHNSMPWHVAFEKMRNEISMLDFDVAILGCGAYGLPLAAEIKRSGKMAVHIGGGSQILFGIKGKRWDEHEDVSKLYNEYWKRPYEWERPANWNTVEEGCYW